MLTDRHRVLIHHRWQLLCNAMQLNSLGILVVYIYSAQYTVHSATLPIADYRLQIAQYKLQSVQCRLYIGERSTVHSGQCTVECRQCTLWTAQCTVYSGQCTVYNTHCTVHSADWTFGETGAAVGWRCHILPNTPLHTGVPDTHHRCLLEFCQQMFYH